MAHVRDVASAEIAIALVVRVALVLGHRLNQRAVLNDGLIDLLFQELDPGLHAQLHVCVWEAGVHTARQTQDEKRRVKSSLEWSQRLTRISAIQTIAYRKCQGRDSNPHGVAPKRF